jgi:DNA-binding NarL/FixJ family response regulator
VIADDHPIVLAGLESVLRREPDIHVVARCTDGAQTLQAVAAHRPDILLLDLRMPHIDGWEVLRQLRHDERPTRVIILAAVVDDRELLDVVRLGGRGVVLKEMAPRSLVDCIRKVNDGRDWFDASMMRAAMDHLARQQAGAVEMQSVLSRREVDVLMAAAHGLRNRQIGQRLAISEGTVKLHLHAIYTKLRVDSRTALILKLKETGFLGSSRPDPTGAFRELPSPSVRTASCCPPGRPLPTR